MKKQWIVWLVVVSCAPRDRQTRESVYREAVQLQQAGEAERAMALTDAEIAGLHGKFRSPLDFKFRILKSELLQSLKKGKEAAAWRDTSIPDAPEFSEAIARQKMDQGWARYRAKEYPAAMKLLDDAAGTAEQQHYRELLSLIEQRRGTVLLALDRFAEAETSYRTSLQLANDSGDAFLRASAIGNLGVLAMNAAHYDEAIDWFEQIGPESKQPKSVLALTQHNLGWCYFSLGDLDRALALFQNAERLFARTGKLDNRQISAGNIGNVYYARGDLRAALSEYRRALEMARQASDDYWAAMWLNNLATTSLDLGDTAAAEKYNTAAIKLQNDDLGHSAARLWPSINAARIRESTKEFAGAEELYGQVAASKVEDPAPRIEAGERLAKLLASEQRLVEAEKQFRSTVALADESRAKLGRDESKLSYFASVIRIHQEYVEYLYAHGRPDEALLIAEASRARLLSEKSMGGEREPPATIAKWRRVSRDSKTILLSYWLAPERSILWMISASGVRSFHLPPEAQIRRLVELHSRAILALRDPIEQEASPARQLFDMLLGQVQSDIPAGSRVAIVPDGALHDLNFETLISGGGRPHYWIEEVTVSVLPSLRALMIARPRARSGSELLLIGDPVPVNGRQFPKLANAGREIADIRKQFAQSNVVAFTETTAGPNAYRDARPERFSIIHFAAHATANRESPLDSAVILTPVGNVYKLYARDIIQQPIRADLVTISACRSAGARTYAGEGLVGFAWAFLEAGARNVVAGLWEVDDDSTGALMNLMYREIYEGSGPADSLRAAKRSLLHSTRAVRKPYYWAPFQTFTGSLP
ncbi:MAG: CHAT domain-containing protein [Acidobacteriota bacterium]|nr:CHAT domain-containing protein [Acidobacteriota bacterium]